MATSDSSKHECGSGWLRTFGTFENVCLRLPSVQERTVYLDVLIGKLASTKRFKAKMMSQMC